MQLQKTTLVFILKNMHLEVLTKESCDRKMIYLYKILLHRNIRQFSMLRFLKLKLKTSKDAKS